MKICSLRDLQKKVKVYLPKCGSSTVEKKRKKRIEKPHQTTEESGNGGIGSNKLKKKHEKCQLH